MPDASERAAVLALVARTQLAWHWAGALIEEAGGAKRLLAGDLGGVAWFNRRDAEALARAVEPDAVARCAELADRLATRGVGLVTVLDDDYPTALHAAYDRPPFLFVRGSLTGVGDRAIAVTGTPRAPLEAVERAGALGAALARAGVAVVACPRGALGLAALRAALDMGGQAVAVLDAGIDRLDRGPDAEADQARSRPDGEADQGGSRPDGEAGQSGSGPPAEAGQGGFHPDAEAGQGGFRPDAEAGQARSRSDGEAGQGGPGLTAELERRLRERGAVVSPCWPDAPPEPASDLHAATLSGLALGLVVLDGEEGSPPHRQAHRCLDQARRLFLSRSLVLRESWAKHYADHPGATVVDAVGDILEVVAAMVQLRTQLSAMT
jgi:predicted Rossmann fold nucleotide-binding protein DprA/Smf involved in DNA uptake